MRSSSRVMRPKSMATVVVVLPAVWVRSSMPALALVMTASVRRGLISETAPTRVVLPTPKPPATTIFAEVVARLGAAALELAKSTEDPFEQRDVGLVAGFAAGSGLVDGDQAGLGQVGHEDPGDTEREAEQRGDLGDGLDVRAERADPLVLGQHRGQAGRVDAGRDQRLDGQFVPRPGAATGHRERPDQGPGVGVVLQLLHVAGLLGRLFREGLGARVVLVPGLRPVVPLLRRHPVGLLVAVGLGEVLLLARGRGVLLLLVRLSVADAGGSERVVAGTGVRDA